MLWHALRRLLWMGPILIGVTLASFVLVSSSSGAVHLAAVEGRLERIDPRELLRARFLDLPRFFNAHPTDVRTHLNRCLARLRIETAASAAAQELAALGAAAFPYLLPELDGLEPTTRTRAALALAPVAERMGLGGEATRDPARAVLFWDRYWTDRAVDFRPENARRAVRRLAQRGTTRLESDAFELDTFALREVMTSLGELSAELRTRPLPDALAQARRLVALAAHVTGRDDTVAPDARAEEASACVRRWQAWWLAHDSDYAVNEGLSGLWAMFTQTQYAKWTERMLVLGLSERTDGTSMLRLLVERARSSCALILSAMLLAYTSVIGLSAWAVAARTRRVDRMLLGFIVALGTLPSGLLAGFAHPAEVSCARMLAAVACLGAALIAAPLGQARVGMRRAYARDFARAAMAFGASPWRLALRHALRTAALPLAALFGGELSFALGAAIVVETAFGIPGLGPETVRAVRTNDVAWLVGLSFFTSFAVTAVSIASDLSLAALDPRLARWVLRRDRPFA